MRVKIGDRIRYKSHYIQYHSLGDRHPKQGVDIREVIVVASAKGTDYHESDYIVCNPKDYPIKDLRSMSNAKHWGIGKEQIIEVLN